MRKMLMMGITGCLLATTLVGCDNDSAVASANVSKDADNFKVLRRIVFYNVIQDKYIIEMTGFCSIKSDATDKQLEVICNEGPGIYRKHFLGYSDNVTYTVEQLKDSAVSQYHYKIIFKPQSILPLQNIEVR